MSPGGGGDNRDGAHVDETLLDIDFIPLTNDYIRLHNRFQQKRQLEYDEIKKKEREKAKQKKSYRQSIKNIGNGSIGDNSSPKISRRTNHDTLGISNNNRDHSPSNSINIQKEIYTSTKINNNEDKVGSILTGSIGTINNNSITPNQNNLAPVPGLPNLDKIHIPLTPNIDLEAGKIIPEYLCAEVPPDLIGVPLVDPDPHYADKGTYVVVDNNKMVYRFSMHYALYIFGPLNPIRRMTTQILTKSLFSQLIMTTIIINCMCMVKTKKQDDKLGHILDTYVEQIFLAIYTVEMLIKVLSRGFVLSGFTYLRDSSNILDIVVIATAYVEIAMTLTSTSEPGSKTTTIPGMNALRAFRVLRALKAISVVPGLKCIVSSLIESVKALRDVMILTLFTLLVFSLVGMQLLTGILQCKCIAIWPGFNSSVVNMTNGMMSFSRPNDYDFLDPPMPCEPKNLKMRLDKDQGWKYIEDPFLKRGIYSWFPKDAFNHDYTHSYTKEGYRIKRLTSRKLLDEWSAKLAKCEEYIEQQKTLKSTRPDNDPELSILNEKIHQCTNTNATFTQQVNKDWFYWVNDPNNICYVGGQPLICGNSTTAGQCAAGYAWGFEKKFKG